MNTPIHINIACEDELSEAVLRKILNETGRPYSVNNIFRKSGFGYLKKNVRSFNHASQVTPYLMLTDLDTDECAPEKIRTWLNIPPHPNFIFRIAVKEVEAWLLADAAGIAAFFEITAKKIPGNVEGIPDPKRELISLARKSRKRVILDDIVPDTRTAAKQGRNYNGRMKKFVYSHWNIPAAMTRSESLRKTVLKLREFTPRFM